MHIYIDESGAFATDALGNHSLSIIAAVVVPDTQLKSLEGAFNRLKAGWGITGETEVKGRRLDEKEYAAFFALLSKYTVIAEVVLIDRLLTPDDKVEAHKIGQAQRLRDSMKEGHYHSNLIRQVNTLADRLADLSVPEYCQFVLLTSLIENVMSFATLYLVTRRPRELSRFNWCIDSKKHGGIELESLWKDLVLPFLQSRSKREPHLLLEGADYSHFSRFDSVEEETPAHLLAPGETPERPFRATNIKKLLMENLSFSDSKDFIGLQIVDLVANCFRRSLKGHLQKEGYLGLGRLIIRRKEGAFRLCMPIEGDRPDALGGEVEVPYGKVLKELEKEHRSMLPPNY